MPSSSQGRTKQGAEGAVLQPGKLNVFFPNIVFDFAGLFLVAIFVHHLHAGDPCEGVWSFPPQTKNPR